MPAPAIEVSGLTKTFPATSWLVAGPARQPRPVHALRGVDLEVAPGQVLGLLGPNGGGKTTLLEILASYLLPTAGRAAIDGFEVGRADRELRRRVGYCAAGGRGLYPRLTGRENLEFFACLAGQGSAQARERIEALWRLVGLDTYADGIVARYSDGMRQRLALARALLSDPAVLLLDEPTRSLDPPSATAWRAGVRRDLAGKTILVATHDLVEAEEFCDRVVILSEGRIVGSGAASGVRELAKSSFPNGERVS